MKLDAGSAAKAAARAPKKASLAAAIPPPSLHSNISGLFTSGKHSDLTITVDDGSFNAHSQIIAARSPYFDAMLSGPMKEASSKTITENEVDAETFEAVLHWIYSDKLPDKGEHIAETLLFAANRYCCEDLKQLCEIELCRSLDVKNVAARFVLSDQTGAALLKELQAKLKSKKKVNS